MTSAAPPIALPPPHAVPSSGTSDWTVGHVGQQLHALTSIYLQWHVLAVDLFAVLADPKRRELLTCLSAAECTVGELQMAVGASQPTVSKHLRVLRDHGLARSTAEGSVRRYQLDPRPLQELDEWLASFRAQWSSRLDALGIYLDDLDTEERS